MRRVTLGGPVGTDSAALLRWVRDAFAEIESASCSGDLTTITQNYTIVGTYTATRTLNVTTATLPQVIALIATFLSDLQKGGANRTQ